MPAAIEFSDGPEFDLIAYQVRGFCIQWCTTPRLSGNSMQSGTAYIGVTGGGNIYKLFKYANKAYVYIDTYGRPSQEAIKSMHKTVNRYCGSSTIVDTGTKAALQDVARSINMT